jgi:hypothetical protein
VNPMRFYLVFDVQGNAAQQLQSIGAQFATLGAVAGTSAAGVQSFHGSVIAMIHGLHQLNTVGQDAISWGSAFLSTIYGISHAVIETASSFETMRERMRFAFNDNSEQIWSNIQRFAVDSVWRFGEVADVVGGLGIALRNLDGEFTNLPRSYESRTGGMIDALQAIGDTAAGTGRSLSMVGFEVEQMMTGMFRGAHMVLRLTQQETETIKHAISTTTDAGQQFSAIMAVLAAHYGGATEALGHTFQFLAMQIPDILEIIRNEVGKTSLGILSVGLREAVDWLRSLVHPSNKAALDSLSGGFEVLATMAVSLGRGLINVGRSVNSFIAANPEVVKFAAVMGVVLSVLTVVGGTLLTVTAGLGVLIASVQLAGATILSSMGMSIGILTAVGAGISGLIALGAILHSAYDRNLGGIKLRFQQLSLVVEGLSQAMHNWTGSYTAITSGLATQMEEAGILGFFVNLVSWIARAREWWTGFVTGIQAGMASLDWGSVYEGILSIERALLSVGVSLHLLDPAAATSFDTMQARGTGFANLVNQILVPSLNLLAVAFRLSAWTLENVIIPSMSTMHNIGMTILNNWDGIKAVIGLAGLFMFPILGTVALLLSTTNSWGTALDVVKEAFQAILGVAEILAETVAYIGRGLAVIPDAFFRLVGASHLIGSAEPTQTSTSPVSSGAAIPTTYEAPGRIDVSTGPNGDAYAALTAALQRLSEQQGGRGGGSGQTPGSPGGGQPVVVNSNLNVDGEILSRATQRVGDENSSRSGRIPSTERLWSGP